MRPLENVDVHIALAYDPLPRIDRARRALELTNDPRQVRAIAKLIRLLGGVA